jgi:hypothetical protein
VLCPSRQHACLLRAIGLLLPGIAFLAQVLSLVFSILEQQHQQVALTFPGRFFLGVQSFSYRVLSTSLRTNRRDAVSFGWINPALAVGLTFRSTFAGADEFGEIRLADRCVLSGLSKCELHRGYPIVHEEHEERSHENTTQSRTQELFFA